MEGEETLPELLEHFERHRDILTPAEVSAWRYLLMLQGEIAALKERFYSARMAMPPCPICGGEGFLTGGERCERCEGTGFIKVMETYPADFELIRGESKT